MNFFTPVPWTYRGPQLHTQESFFLLGSCFSGEFSRRLENSGEKYLCNPLGTLYDPLSMVRVLEILEADEWTPDEIFFHRGLWRHPNCHTELGHPEQTTAVKLIQAARDAGKKAWTEATVAIFTFGTAFTHNHRDTGRLWANCHTLPGEQFKRQAKSPEQMALAWQPILNRLKTRGVKVFLTLSPVRHLRNDPAENSLSKALLRIFLHSLEQEGLGTYFPSAEILLDELRDYRWYGADMVHPSPQAAEYITRRFWEKAASKELQDRAEAYSALVREYHHRSRHEGSQEDHQRRENWLNRRNTLVSKYPGWNPPDSPPTPEARQER